MASIPTHPDEKQEALDPEVAKILDDKMARAGEDEKQSVPLRQALKEDGATLKPPVPHWASP